MRNAKQLMLLLFAVLVTSLSACTSTKQLQIDPEVRPFFEQVLAEALDNSKDIKDYLPDSHFEEKPELMLPGYLWVLTRLFDQPTENLYFCVPLLSSALCFDDLEGFRKRAEILQEIACGPYQPEAKLAAALLVASCYCRLPRMFGPESWIRELKSMAGSRKLEWKYRKSAANILSALKFHAMPHEISLPQEFLIDVIRKEECAFIRPCFDWSGYYEKGPITFDDEEDEEKIVKIPWGSSVPWRCEVGFPTVDVAQALIDFIEKDYIDADLRRGCAGFLKEFFVLLEFDYENLIPGSEQWRRFIEACREVAGRCDKSANMMDVVIGRFKQQFPEVDFDTAAGAKIIDEKLANDSDVLVYRYNRCEYMPDLDIDSHLTRREMILQGIRRDIDDIFSGKAFQDTAWEDEQDCTGRLSLFIDDPFFRGLDRDAAVYDLHWLNLDSEDIKRLTAWETGLRKWWADNENRLVWDHRMQKYRVGTKP